MVTCVVTFLGMAMAMRGRPLSNCLSRAHRRLRRSAAPTEGARPAARLASQQRRPRPRGRRGGAPRMQDTVAPLTVRMMVSQPMTPPRSLPTPPRAVIRTLPSLTSTRALVRHRVVTRASTGERTGQEKGSGIRKPSVRRRGITVGPFLTAEGGDSKPAADEQGYQMRAGDGAADQTEVMDAEGAEGKPDVGGCLPCVLPNGAAQTLA